jgi:hypothetical protein
MPLYGVQFHPEAFMDGEVGPIPWLIDWVYPNGMEGTHLDGRNVLANFFRIAGILP